MVVGISYHWCSQYSSGDCNISFLKTIVPEKYNYMSHGPTHRWKRRWALQVYQWFSQRKQNAHEADSIVKWSDDWSRTADLYPLSLFLLQQSSRCSQLGATCTLHKVFVYACIMWSYIISGNMSWSYWCVRGMIFNPFPMQEISNVFH